MEWLNIFRIIYFLGAINSLFFSILIFSKKNKALSDKILGSWLIILSVQLFYPFIYLSDLENLQKLIGYEAPLSIIHPVFLYFYTLAVTNQYKKSVKNIIIVIPVAVFILIIPFFLNILPENKIEILNGDFFEMFDSAGIIIFGIMYLFMGYILFYFIFKSYQAIRKYKKNVLQIYSYHDNIDLLWLRRLIVYFLVICISTILLSILFFYTNISLAFTDFIYYVMLVAFVFLLAYWGYQQGNIFQFEKQEENFITKDEKESLQTNNFRATGKLSNEAKKLEKIMNQEKPFLNPTLSIHDLSQIINIPAHQLSKIIHKEFGKNFFEFVNEYRINQFKDYIKLPKYKNYTILGIALECGFNSKSAFNRIFKEYTGQTPGEFKKNL